MRRQFVHVGQGAALDVHAHVAAEQKRRARPGAARQPHGIVDTDQDLRLLAARIDLAGQAHDSPGAFDGRTGPGVEAHPGS